MCELMNKLHDAMRRANAADRNSIPFLATPQISEELLQLGKIYLANSGHIELAM